MPSLSLHYGANARIHYTWNGVRKVYGSRVASVMAYYERVKDDPRFELLYIEARRRQLQPDEIQVKR